MVQIAPGEEMGTLRPGALLISSLRDTTSLIFINVSMGDSAVISQRSCGCTVEQIGWTTHLHTIRSFEKLTAAGVTFLDVDVARVLDEVLPARFGGGPGDYQLVEREGRDGQPALQLMVHPRVGSFDERGVADEFLRAMGQGSGGERLAAELWRETGILSVRSEPPLRTSGGKVLHLHVDNR
jgi:phenylacetate-coenzyme A ligase PaaK-like adenylate-forming protein